MCVSYFESKIILVSRPPSENLLLAHDYFACPFYFDRFFLIFVILLYFHLINFYNGPTIAEYLEVRGLRAHKKLEKKYAKILYNWHVSCYLMNRHICQKKLKKDRKLVFGINKTCIFRWWMLKSFGYQNKFSCWEEAPSFSSIMKLPHRVLPNHQKDQFAINTQNTEEKVFLSPKAKSETIFSKISMTIQNLYFLYKFNESLSIFHNSIWIWKIAI